MKKIEIDEGYFFGMGVFETIAVEAGTPLFLKEHLQRMRKSLETLQISCSEFETLTEARIKKECSQIPYKRGVLKICVSDKNVFFQTRENTYYAKQYEKGFTTKVTSVRRNETSPFTYVKSLNSGDTILEKRKAGKAGFSEAIFLNTKGKLAEGAVSNVFFIKDKKIYTPTVSSGILPGILRDYIIKTYDVLEKEIALDEVTQYDEMFLTNSLMGIMPVSCLEGEKKFLMEQGKNMAKMYLKRFTKL